MRLLVDLTKLPVKNDLILGLYGAMATGSGVTGVTLTVAADDTNLVSKAFTSVATP